MGGQLSVETQLKRIIPKLDYAQHKGSCGKVAILGGSVEYTGAPYFSAMTALRVGCDISHVFCHEEAATAIKAYSPELIVHPFFKQDYNLEDCIKWADTIQCFVVGPGLGRDQYILDIAKAVCGVLLSKGKRIVFDADGLFMITKNIEMIKNKKNVILTPNVAEYGRLCEAVGLPVYADVYRLAKELGGVTIFQKGRVDVISNGTYTVQCKHSGSPRRCGGQGDLLSGALAAFIAWSVLAPNTDENDLLVSGVAVSALIKECNAAAFKQKGRGMIATDMLDNISFVFNQIFEEPNMKLNYS
ncbi:hypothetical protein EIN_496870 [Entamoeba invadens IP1]|uniref:ATP-dependent (S)-NAD(P)H-hydrate dehydratase n=2 Tax=Entamoeba invadens TaxID=33085 RepID=A0A0A1TZT1_ENTIV|nr:hypothetical protein EIN_496870 [Entamoeba invadens IP1]ELP87132.1 hypothetical protein EIN_496870 [Entamoeba invadens IP1]BAN41857.1 hypothetical protein, conserved [Entamoeba invadens]|eukprot:XP_004253903.1 hypothetical protein EIN_496870 [Entamoeba invadens IP1]